MRMNSKSTSVRVRLFWLGRQVRRALSYLVDGFWWPPLALLVLAVIWFSVASGIPLPTEQTVEKYGVYGDSFGRLTSLFTALGFGGLIITLLLQQRQIRAHEEGTKQSRQKDEKDRYEAVLFRLLDIYRQTLSEVRVGEATGRDVLRKALERVDAGVVEEGVNGLPRVLQSKLDSDSLTENDRQHIDYLHYRNFKIVGTEIHPQARLVDTFEVLLEHMVRGAPEHLLINSYKELVFAQITYLESRYFFLVALSHPIRAHLRDLLAKTGFLDRISRSQIHQIHRDMYKEYWGQAIEQRDLPPSVPMPTGRIKRALRAYKESGGVPKTTYTPLGVRQSQSLGKKGSKGDLD